MIKNRFPKLCNGNRSSTFISTSGCKTLDAHKPIKLYKHISKQTLAYEAYFVPTKAIVISNISRLITKS